MFNKTTGKWCSWCSKKRLNMFFLKTRWTWPDPVVKKNAVGIHDNVLSLGVSEKSGLGNAEVTHLDISLAKRKDHWNLRQLSFIRLLGPEWSWPFLISIVEWLWSSGMALERLDVSKVLRCAEIAEQPATLWQEEVSRFQVAVQNVQIMDVLQGQDRLKIAQHPHCWGPKVPSVPSPQLWLVSPYPSYVIWLDMVTPKIAQISWVSPYPRYAAGFFGFSHLHLPCIQSP